MPASPDEPPSAADALELFPRVDLGHWPTPLEPCRRLQAEIGGPLIWLKRDDCSGLALGGNKTRKLEYLLGEATQREATGVVTFGAVQSNHARQTAAACAALGMPCDLVLTDMVDRPTEPYRTSGNRLLDDLLGATVHVVADNDEAAAVAAELAEADPGRFLIEPGGSSPTGTLGYVAMAGELRDQLDAVGVEPQRVVAAAATCGTVAGLIVGLDPGPPTVVDAASVYADADTTTRAIESLVGRTAELLGVPGPATAWRVADRTLGTGYGIPTAESRAAISLLARTAGVLLDPVYTAKAFAHLVAELPRLDPAGEVVFVHTGGQAGLFAYSDDG